MSKIIISDLQTLNKNFSKFTRTTITRGKPNNIYTISQLQNFQTGYSKSGFFNDFILQLEDFALTMEENGLLDLSGIVFSKLAKLPAKPELKERFLRGGIRIARKQGDPIHVLARIVDLKKLYEQQKLDTKRYAMLFQEEKALEEIITDFSCAKSEYKTVKKASSPINKYKLQLAICKTDIAKELNKEASYLKLLEARDLFEEVGNENGVNYVEKHLALISATRK